MRIALLVLLLLSGLHLSAQSPVLPAPKKYIEHEKATELNDTLYISERFYKAWMAYLYEFLPSFTILPGDGSRSLNALKFSVDRSKDLDSSEYHLSFSERTFSLKAGSLTSEFYGVVTLIQILKAADEELKEFELQDYPDFEWRGLHLDVSRHFFHTDEVMRLLDLMAFYKLNKFHWHLTDDQGWRIQIDKYPLLTEVGAYRDSTLIGHYSDEPQKYDHRVYGGFYTKEDIRTVIDHAAKRGIEVIPEIEMPGHSRAALAAYPELSCTGVEQGAAPLWGVFEDIYCSKEESINFLQDVLTEVIDLFPSRYIHIGGDEAPKSRWKTCPNCQKVISENGLKDEHELQSYFIRRMDTFLSEKGKTLIGWDEILEGGLSPNAVVMSWRGEEGGIEAAKQGHYAIMTPTTYCYFDYYQSSNENEPVAIGGYLPLEKVYKFDVIPEELQNTNEANYILGGQANLWTEYILDFNHLQYMAFPRAIALAQSVWSAKKPDYSDFLNTYLLFHEKMLTEIGVNYSSSIHYPTMKIVRKEQGIGVHFRGAGDQYRFDVFAREVGGHSMNGGQVTTEKDTLLFERTKQGDREFTFRVGNDQLNSTAEFDLKIHSAIGLPIQFITQPHPKYANNGSLNLVDGVLGNMPWKGSEWTGFNTTDIEMVIDLTEKRFVDSVNIGFLENKGQWIYFPEEVKIYTSKNGKCWKGKINAEKIARNTVIEVSREIRYIKLEIESIDEIPEGAQGAGNVPWTFIDEIMIH